MGKRERSFALGTVVAAGVGYLAGILTAPKSGKETRKDIQTAAVKAKHEAEKQLKNLHSELNDLINVGSKKAKQATDAAKSGFNDALTDARTAKEKAREILSALHEGETEDKDLQKAIDDVKKAMQHLKTYVDKNTK
ncbi:MAG: hypothetical protein NVSMB46_06740 [Candidatus Saccharimonadales bacterium]